MTEEYIKKYESEFGILSTEMHDFIIEIIKLERKRIVEIIKTPMSTEFEDPEEESADYSVEDFRARLLKQIID
jgi:hypothetical protein